MTSTNPPETDRIITSGFISLSYVSGVVAFDVLLTNVDCVVSDRTVTLLKKYKAEIYQMHLLINLSNINYFFEHFYNSVCLIRTNTLFLQKNIDFHSKKCNSQSLYANFKKKKWKTTVYAS